MATKSDLLQENTRLKEENKVLRDLLKKLKDLPDVYKAFSKYYVPVGKAQDAFGHEYGSEIRDAVADQYDGTVGKVLISLYRKAVPFEYVVADVSYNDQDGTFVNQFWMCREISRDQATKWEGI